MFSAFLFEVSATPRSRLASSTWEFPIRDVHVPASRANPQDEPKRLRIRELELELVSRGQMILEERYYYVFQRFSSSLLLVLPRCSCYKTLCRDV